MKGVVFSAAGLAVGKTLLPEIVTNTSAQATYGPKVSDFSPEQPTEEIADTLDYFVTKHPETGLTGTHYLGQTIEGTASFYNKFNDPKSFEMHLWDETYIRLPLDNSDPKKPYRLKNGIWMKRKMKVGEKLLVQDTITWFNQSCQEIEEKPFAYEVTLEKHLVDYAMGEDLLPQDVIVLKYQPIGGDVERDYYSKEWGWIKWELYDESGAHLKQTAVFNKVAGGKLRPPDKSVICPTNRPEKLIP